MDRPIDRDSLCFCCGADNERGLRLSITYPEKGSAETSLAIPSWFTGFGFGRTPLPGSADWHFGVLGGRHGAIDDQEHPVRAGARQKQ